MRPQHDAVEKSAYRVRYGMTADRHFHRFAHGKIVRLIQHGQIYSAREFAFLHDFGFADCARQSRLLIHKNELSVHLSAVIGKRAYHVHTAVQTVFFYFGIVFKHLR